LITLIHNVGHTRLPNAQLVKENTEIAKIYKNKSVAEQNSVDIAWDLLMEPSYGDLRNCIYQSQEELERFRHLIVNAVMATDIADKEQAAFRRKRWEKATIQASDVAHSMQHWHVSISSGTRDFSTKCIRLIWLDTQTRTLPRFGIRESLGF
jgi:hypothetical protein